MQIASRLGVCFRISIAVKRRHDHRNSYKGKHLIGLTYSSEDQSIISMLGDSSMKADNAESSISADDGKWSLTLGVA